LPLQILQATNWYAPAYAFGGPARLLEAYADLLRARGVRVDVVTSDLLTRTSFIGPHVADLGPLGRITYVKASRIPGLVNRNIHLHWRLYVEVVRRAARYDYVQFADYRGALPLLLLLLGKVKGVRLIHHSFGMISQRRGVKKVVWDFLFRRLFTKNVSLCFAENESERQEYIRIGVAPERVRVLPHPVSVPQRYRVTEAPDGPPTSAAERASPGGSLKLCFVGRLHATKGVVRTVELVHALQTYFPDVHLTIMGNDEGALKGIVRRIELLDLASRVEFRPPAYDDTRYDLYAKSDAFVILPVENLQTSLAAVEALAVGTPIITNDNCRIDGLGEYVLYVDRMPIQDLARQIDALRAIPKKQIARDAQHTFSFDAVARGLGQAICPMR